MVGVRCRSRQRLRLRARAHRPGGASQKRVRCWLNVKRPTQRPCRTVLARCRYAFRRTSGDRDASPGRRASFHLRTRVWPSSVSTVTRQSDSPRRTMNPPVSLSQSVCRAVMTADLPQLFGPTRTVSPSADSITVCECDMKLSRVMRRIIRPCGVRGRSGDDGSWHHDRQMPFCLRAM